MNRRNKLLFLSSVVLFLVALADLLDNKHGKWNQQSPFQNAHSRSIHSLRRYAVNIPEVKVRQAYYNQFYLAEEWPGTICKFINNCTNIPKKFVIHGLWPQNTTAWPPTNCCGGLQASKCRYNSTLINATLRSELSKTWPALYGPNDGIWGYQWRTHGACSVDEIPQPDYFQKANNLYNKYDLIQILRSAEIKDNGTIYRVKDIKAAIKKSTDLNVLVKCYLDEGKNTSYLQEIYLCVNQLATAFESCDPETVDRCKARAVFPAV